MTAPSPEPYAVPEPAWLLAEEFDQQARRPGARPDPDVLSGLVMFGNDDVVAALLESHTELCTGEQVPEAQTYAEHLTALADLLEPDGRRAVLAAVDVAAAELYERTGQPQEALRRAQRCAADLAELMPGLLGDHAWVLACLAEKAGRAADAHAHASRARDLFAADERWAEAARAAEAAAGRHERITPEAVADWRRAAELFVVAGEPDEARECAEQVCFEIVKAWSGIVTGDEPDVSEACAAAAALAREHTLLAHAVYLDTLAVALLVDSSTPFEQVAARLATCRRELETLDRSSHERRRDDARLDLFLGAACTAHSRWADAERLLSGALPVLRELGTADEIAACEDALRGLLTAMSEGRLGDGATTDGPRLFVEGMRLARDGRLDDALTCLTRARDAAVAEGDPHFGLIAEVVVAVLHLDAGDLGPARAEVARVEARLADGDPIPRTRRIALTAFAGLLRAELARLDGRPDEQLAGLATAEAELAALGARPGAALLAVRRAGILLGAGRSREALDVGLPAALALDALRCTLPDAQRRDLWAAQVAQGFANAVRAAAACRDIRLLAELLEVTRGNAVPLPRSPDDRVDAVSALSAAVDPDPGGGPTTVRPGPAAVASGQERTTLGLPAFVRTPWGTVALGGALEAARRYVDPARAPVTVDWTVREPWWEGLMTEQTAAENPEEPDPGQTDSGEIDDGEIDPGEIDEAEAWRLGEEFDRAARDPGTAPDADLVAAVADTATDEVLFGLLDALGELCAGGEPAVAEHYAAHLTALAPLLGRDGHRGVLAAVDVHTAGLYQRTGNPEEARRRVVRCRADLADVLPGLLGDREWVLACLAEDDGRPDEARAHGLRARDLFAEHERRPEAARVGEATAGTHPVLTTGAFGDWRRVVELYAAAGEPAEARRCVELAVGLLAERMAGPEATTDRDLPGLCATARALAREHGLDELAARLGLALAEIAGDSDLPWTEVADRHAQATAELAALPLDPVVKRADLARSDLALARSAVAHRRIDEARKLVSGALPELREAGAEDEALLATRMLAALDASVSPGTAGPLLDDTVTDPTMRIGMLLTEAMRLTAQGDPAAALARLDEAAALVPDGAAHVALVIDAVRAAVSRTAGKPVDVAGVLARVDAALAAPADLPRSARAMLEQVAALLRTGATTPAPPVADPTPAEIDAETAAVLALPAAAPDRATRAAALVGVLVRADPFGDPARLRPLDDLVEIADGAVPETPEWARLRTWARMLGLQRRIALGELTDPEQAAAQLAPLEAAAGDDPALRPLVAATRAVLQMLDGVRHDGAGDATAALVASLDTVFAGLDRTDPRIAPILAALEAMGAAAQEGPDGDRATRIDDMRRLVEQLPPGHLRAAAEEAAGRMAALHAAAAGGPVGRLDDDQLAALMSQADAGGFVDPDPAFHQLWVFFHATQGGAETDPERIDTGIDAARRAVAGAGPENPHRVFYRMTLALGLWRRHELTLDTEALHKARNVLEEARAEAQDQRHPLWQQVNEMLADVNRLLGGGADASRAAVAGLRRHVWQVLVAPDLASAADAVREAGADAVRAAVSCLRDDDAAGAIGALDAGRGLALFAAVEFRSVPQRLEEAGEPELARRWRDEVADTGDPEQLPRTLRRTVFHRLVEHSPAGALLEPPGLPDIRRALRDLDADALVYLLPGEDQVPGFAIAAAAAGSGVGTSYLALPLLTPGNNPDVERYLTTLARRDAAAVRDLAREFDIDDDTEDDPGATADAGDGALAESLDAVCDWAWHAAMGPFIESYLPRLPAPAGGRPPRVVLVPMGDLARIPWQAARRPDGTHAVQLVAISQAASARMLCLSARRPAVPPSPVGLVVGDPDTTDPATGRSRGVELTAARLEAYAVRETFYPGARYVGRLPNSRTSRSGPGSAQQVRDWLTAGSSGAGTLLHLACHGVLEAAGAHARSYLLLADGEELSAEELIEHMARAPGGRGIGLVVLAACRTGLSISGYDEAYSLGTAFLAGGADTVLSTQWSIPDDATSVLMFMFHHYLRTEGRPAWAALHAAQNWMLDPQPEVPATMPGPLRRRLGTAAGRADVTAWAAFVHWGR